MPTPPSSVETYTFDYDRKAGKMRFRLDGDTWLFDRFVGSWDMVENLPNGKLLVNCKLKVQDDVGYVYAPKDAQAEEVPDDAIDTHWRLCYNRADSERTQENHWRLRDERTQILHSNDITGYRGLMSVNYFDGGPHIFCDGPAVIDEDGVAHFGQR